MKPALLCAALCLAVPGQSRKFDVVSVKRCHDNEPIRGGAPTPGRLALNCATTANLIRMAYVAFATGQPGVPVSPTFLQQPISGGPSWIDSDRYRIDAVANGPESNEMMRGPMMQALLEDRFNLKLHRESKETNVFELTAMKSGAKLQAAKVGSCGTDPCGILHRNPDGGFDISGATIADLCRQLTGYVDRDIIDKTGIAGVFDLHLDITPADLQFGNAAPDPSSPFAPGDGSSIASALGKLGLQMRPAKGLSLFLVIDHVERPSEN